MSNLNQTGAASTLSGDVGIIGATSSKITNLVMDATPGTESSLALTADLKQLTIRSRTRAKLQFTFVSGESGTKYITISPGTVWHIDQISFASSTLYIQSSKASNTVEIMELF